MNEISKALKVVSAAMKTVRIIDIVRKLVVLSAVSVCCVLAIGLRRK